MTAILDLRERVQRNLPLLTGFTAIAGLRLYLPIYVAYCQQLGLSTAQAGLLWAITSAAALASEGLTGLMADCWGYRRSLLLGSCLLCVGFTCTYLAPLAPSVWWWLVGSQSLIGIAVALVYTATPQAFASKSAAWLGHGEGQYHGFAGRSLGSMYATSALAAALTWGIIHVWWQSGLRLTWIFQAGLSAGMVLVAYLTVDPEEFRSTRRASGRPSWWQVAQARRVFLPLLPLVIVAVISAPSLFVAQAWCASKGLGPAWSTAIMVVGFLIMGAVTVKIAAWVRRLGVARVAMIAAVVITLSYLGMAWLPGWWQLLAVVAIFLPCGIPIIGIACYVDRFVPEYKATALSMYSAAIYASSFGLLPAFGWMMDRYSFRVASEVWAIGFGMSFVAVASLLFQWKTRVRAETPLAPVALLWRRGCSCLNPLRYT